MKYKLLSELKSAAAPVSGQELADRLSVSRTAIWKQINNLRADGYEIVGRPKAGYTLIGPENVITPGAVEARIPAEYRGHVVVLADTDSTNEQAKKIAAPGGFDPGGMVVARRQSDGRGRFGRHWRSPVGGLWMSVVIRPPIPTADSGRVPILASVVVAGAIRELTKIDVRIKWPNDLLINDRKVGGILTEVAAELATVRYIVVGVGLNANFPASLLDDIDGARATSLLSEGGDPVDLCNLAAAIASRLFERAPRLAHDFADVLGDWRRASGTLGRDIVIRASGEEHRGRAVDVGSDGALIVELAGGERRTFRAGEVTLRPKS